MNQLKWRAMLSIALAVGALGGCSLIPDYQRPESPVAQDWAAPRAGAAQALLPWQGFFKDEQLKAGLFAARQQMEKALGPILQTIVKERGANLVLDKQAVVFATASGFDITGDAINRLNQQLPTIKVNLNAPPPTAPKQP